MSLVWVSRLEVRSHSKKPNEREHNSITNLKNESSELNRNSGCMYGKNDRGSYGDKRNRTWCPHAGKCDIIFSYSRETSSSSVRLKRRKQTISKSTLISNTHTHIHTHTINYISITRTHTHTHETNPDGGNRKLVVQCKCCKGNNQNGIGSGIQSY